MLEKYFESEIAEKTVEVFPVWMGTILSGIAALFVFFILVIIVTRVQVKRKTKEIRANNEVLQEGEEKYRALYNNVPLSYQSLDENGFFLDVNPQWLETLGYDRQEVIGRWFGDFLHTDFVDVFKKNFPEFKRRGNIHYV